MKNFHIALISFLMLAAVAGGAWFLTSVMTASGSEDTENLLQGTVEAEGSPAADDTAVAVVNGETISRAQFESTESQIAAQQGLDPATLGDEMRAQMRAQALDAVIGQALLSMTIAETGFEVPEEQVDAQIDAAKGQFESQEAFEQALAAQGTTEADLRSQLRSDILVQAFLEQELDFASISATDEEVEETYEQIAAAQEDVPPLEQARDQVRNIVVQQKQQTLINGYIEGLREDADVEVLL